MKNKIINELSNLGNTADDVAQNLIRLGIKGSRGLCYFCPISIYLNKPLNEKVGIEIICVCDKPVCIVIYCLKEKVNFRFGLKDYPLLKGIAEFINAFDKGQYSEIRQ